MPAKHTVGGKYVGKISVSGSRFSTRISHLVTPLPHRRWTLPKQPPQVGLRRLPKLPKLRRLQLCNNLTSLLNDTQQQQQQQQQHTHRPTPNLTQAEKRALKQLKSDNSVILKPADKGGKLVLQHRDHYQLEALRQLNGKEF